MNKSIAISRLFQPMEECYFLGFQFYGAKAVMDSILPNGLFKIKIEQCHEPQLNNLYALRDNMHKTYMTGHILSGKLCKFFLCKKYLLINVLLLISYNTTFVIENMFGDCNQTKIRRFGKFRWRNS